MNREIKFRAWDKRKNIIREVGCIQFDSDIYNIRIIEPTESAPRNLSLRLFSEFILMQYTGLKDLHVKDIYEADIVSNGLIFGTVVFDSGRFCIKVLKLNSKDAGYDIGDCPPVYEFVSNEVIGNIYENPELL